MIGYFFIAFGVYIDIMSLFRWLKLNKEPKGEGQGVPRRGAGIPFVAWIIYLIVCMGQKNLLLLVVLSVFHVLCHFVIPALHRRSLQGG